MNWLRGVKFKMLVIILIASISLGITVYVAFDTKKQLNDIISEIFNERNPLYMAMAAADVQSSNIPRYAFLATLSTKDKDQRNKIIKKAEDAFSDLKDSLEKIEKSKITETNRAHLAEIKTHLPEIDKILKEGFSILQKNTPESDKEAADYFSLNMPKHGIEVSRIISEMKKVHEDRNLTYEYNSKHIQEVSDRNMLWVVILSTLILWTLGILTGYYVAKKLLEVTQKVEESSEKVAVSSKQLASSSQALSGSSQEQAAAIEETSASLEQMSGMIDSNLKNTEDSVQLASGIMQMTEEASENMSSLSSAMEQIIKSNEKIVELAHLIEEIGEKTELIDEIVFQTKLLSFNASVEAERAGEHGRGFAVVAQEVGNLAQMSGKSAVEIASIVKTAIQSAQTVSSETKSKVEEGFNHCQTTASKIFAVNESVAKIRESSEQILRASQEQSAGIRQINESVDSLNKATQQNAATSEESAASSAELAKLSEGLSDNVDELYQIVEGHEREMSELGKTIKSLNPIQKVFAEKKNKSSNTKQNTKGRKQRSRPTSRASTKSNVHSLHARKSQVTNEERSPKSIGFDEAPVEASKVANSEVQSTGGGWDSL